MQLTCAQIGHLSNLPPAAARAFLRECHMSPEERERLFYVEGRIVEADVLAGAIDAESDALDELRHERDDAQDSNDELTRRVEALESELETAEEKVLTLTSELENAQDQIREAGLDLA